MCNCGTMGDGWIPLNSIIQVNDDQSISVQAPTGWYYVGYREAGAGSEEIFILESGNKEVSCNCTGTGNCLPFVASGPKGSTSGCAGSCTACSQTQKAFDSFEFTILRGGYIDMTAGVAFAEKNSELPAAFEAMFEVEEVKGRLVSFMQKIYGGLTIPDPYPGLDFYVAPEGYSFAPINVFGRVTMMLVPNNALQVQCYGGNGTIAGIAASCSCTEGSCTVKTVSIPLAGSATWCEGSCGGTCTLKIEDPKGTGTQRVQNSTLYSAISYIY
jgi:hypothetical protein